MKRTTSERSGEDRKATVACVTDQFQCERIIRAGRSIAIFLQFSAVLQLEEAEL